MDNDINNIEHHNGPTKGKVIAGIILLGIGATLLLKQFNYFFLPGWIFSFPMLLIILGAYVGAKNNFKNLSSFILIGIGAAFLLDDIFPHFDAASFFWPMAFIGFGIYLILRRKNHESDIWNKKDWKRKWDAGKYNYNYDFDYTYKNPGAKEPIVDYTVNEDQPTDPNTPPSPNPGTNYTGDDHLDAVSIFGGVKKIIFSKNFQGGEIVNVFGGSELDFTQADINGRVYIDVTQIFGGTKIIVPAHWMIVSDMAAVFAGVDDKRIRTTAPLDNNKILVLKGVSIFAGIDIRSY
jgi:predicted membrane protein